MADTHTWRRLKTDEWPKAQEFLEATVGQSATLPNTQTTELIALVDDEDNFIAIGGATILVNMLPVIGDATFADAVEGLRAICRAEDIPETQVTAFVEFPVGSSIEELAKHDSTYSSAGFVLTELDVYMGMV